MRTGICLFLLLHVIQCIVVEKTVHMKGKIQEFQTFGFDKGGTLDIQTSVEPSSEGEHVFIYICDMGQYGHLITELNARQGGICGDFDICELVANTTDPILQGYEVQSKDYYHFLIVRCSSAAQITVSLFPFYSHHFRPNFPTRC